jgi:hypothetical protein
MEPSDYDKIPLYFVGDTASLAGSKLREMHNRSENCRGARDAVYIHNHDDDEDDIDTVRQRL